MKIEVHHEGQEAKSKQPLYKDISNNNQLHSQQNLLEVFQKPNIRLYCSNCELQLTRLHHIITKNQYFCIPCFANLRQFASEYMIRSSLKLSPTSTSWDLMDEVILMTAFKNWGYSNWNQIKLYMQYNQSAFSLQEIKEHYEIYHYNQENHLLHFPSQMPHALPHTSYGQITLRNYEQAIMSDLKISSLKKIQSKGQKKPSSNRNLTSNDSEGGLKPSTLGEMSVIQAQSRLISSQNKNKSSCPVLGYNAKRAQFETWYFDPQAQKLLDQLQFYESDTPEQHALKISIIQQYNRRLDQRTKRKQFVLEYKLLDLHYQVSLSPQQQNASAIFQNYMRYTQNHEEFKYLIDKFTTISKYQSFVSNFYQIKRKQCRNGTLDQASNYLVKEKKKSIQKWEENYGKKKNDKKRKIWKKKCLDNNVTLDQENQQEEDCPMTTQNLQNALKMMKQSKEVQFEGYKMTSLTDVIQPEPESIIAEPQQQQIKEQADSIKAQQMKKEQQLIKEKVNNG